MIIGLHKRLRNAPLWQPKPVKKDGKIIGEILCEGVSDWSFRLNNFPKDYYDGFFKTEEDAREELINTYNNVPSENRPNKRVASLESLIDDALEPFYKNDPYSLHEI